jgi:hypothetical protein
MTLVVGHASKEIGFLVADSLILPNAPELAPKGPVAGELHGLKIQVVHPTTAIAFATSNDVDATLALISDFAASRNDFGDSPEKFFQAYQATSAQQESNRLDSEFLILQIQRDGTKRLAHVSAQGFSYRERAYIGDSAEYSKLKNLTTPGRGPKTRTIIEPDGSSRVVAVTIGESEFDDVSDAMERLVHRRAGSVGGISGCTIRVVDARISKELEYLQAVEASLSPWEGYSGYSLLASNSDARGVGVYYRSGKVGFVMRVGDQEYVRRVPAETIKDFVARAKAQYEMNLTGGSWDALEQAQGRQSKVCPPRRSAPS